MRTVAAGWEVRFGGFAVIDADLEEATRLALSGGQGRNVCSVAQALGLRRGYPALRRPSFSGEEPTLSVTTRCVRKLFHQLDGWLVQRHLPNRCDQIRRTSQPSSWWKSFRT